VIEVNGLDLFQPLPSGGYQQLPTDASGKSTLDLSSWQLVELFDVEVAAGAAGSGSGVPQMPPILETDSTVAVPIVPSVC
jgi:hypothetical protein